MQDAKAAQGTAEAIAAACQRELTQVSSSLASQLEAESMWQGRAQGLQQQLDQAVQDKLHLQHDMATVEAVAGDRQHRVRYSYALALLAYCLIMFLPGCIWNGALRHFVILAFCTSHAAVSSTVLNVGRQHLLPTWYD